MKIDGYTKVILTIIAVLIGVLVLDRGYEPNTAMAQMQKDPLATYSNIEFIPESRFGGFYMFDRRNGHVWRYQVISSKLELRGGDLIGKPGDQVKDIPAEK